MLQSKIHKSFSIQSYNSYKETSSSIKDSIINDAFSRFYTLNNSYSIQTQTHPIFHEREKKDQFSPTRKNGRVDGFTIMAQLRHLQNVAELSKVDHQKEKRNRFLKKQSQQARQKNKWKRAENTLNQPYLETYSNWLKQRQNQNDEQNMILDGESEQQKSLHNSKQSETQLIFKKELKPYKKIVEFTKRKLKMKQQSQKQSCEADRKTHSVDHIKSHTYKSYYKEYTEIARKLQWKQEKDKMKSQGEPNLEQIVDKQMIRIFKKAPKSFKINQKDSKLQQTFNSLKRKSVSASAPHRPSILLNDKSEEDRDDKIRGIMRKSKNMSGRRLTKSVSMNEKTNFDILK